MNFKKFKKGVVLGVAVLAICAVSVPVAFAQPVPGGTLDPTTVPKYVTPLIFPPVLFDDSVDPSFEVSLREFSQQVLPTTGCLAAQLLNPALVCNGDAFPATPLWGYGDPALPGSVAQGGTFNNPSFTIEATRGMNPTDIKTTVKWVNELVSDPDACRVSGDPATDPACAFLPHIIQDQNGVPIIDR